MRRRQAKRILVAMSNGRSERYSRSQLYAALAVAKRDLRQGRARALPPYMRAVFGQLTTTLQRTAEAFNAFGRAMTEALASLSPEDLAALQAGADA